MKLLRLLLLAVTVFNCLPTAYGQYKIKDYTNQPVVLQGDLLLIQRSNNYYSVYIVNFNSNSVFYGTSYFAGIIVTNTGTNLLGISSLTNVPVASLLYEDQGGVVQGNSGLSFLAPVSNQTNYNIALNAGNPKYHIVTANTNVFAILSGTNFYGAGATLVIDSLTNTRSSTLTIQLGAHTQTTNNTIFALPYTITNGTVVTFNLLNLDYTLSGTNLLINWTSWGAKN